ncbi:helix-turn-helix domain-containing protein [Psychroflexus salis]|uniref:HTH cro/C1-type domain-containing protein n=1 Tax=Psychroflexus salis TaxID=1526574 RepID=A0A916ZV06_9FLAO|nr:hypothetical protein GCM10010831_14310 [Psychroflexus salis]
MANISNKEFLKNFGNRLRKHRVLNGFTQAQLASELNVEISQISRIERGLINTSVVNLYKICETLGISPKVLIFDDN